MITRSHFEVVVLGRSVPALLSASLLARRGLRVLLLGQGEREGWSSIAGYRFPGRASPLLPLGAPHVDAPLEELAMGPELMRLVEESDPPLHVAMPERRIDLWRDPADLARELAREFPDVQRPLHDFARLAVETCAAWEGVSARFPHWPPRGWLQRRRAASALASLPIPAGGTSAGPLGEIPESHPFRAAVQGASFALSAVPPWEASPFEQALAFGRWRHRPRRFRGGVPALLALLSEKARALGVVLAFEERAEGIELRAGTVAAVRLAAGSERVGCDRVVSALPPDRLARLLPGGGEASRAGWGGRPAGRRFLLVGLLDAEGVPAGVRGDVVWVARPGGARMPGDLVHLLFEAGPDPGSRFLVAEAWVPEETLRVRGPSGVLREQMLSLVGRVVPFLDRHMRIVDSPHDGVPPWKWPERTPLTVESPWHRGVRAAPALCSTAADALSGLLEPRVAGPVRGLLLGGDSVLPSLGLEGAFLTARAVADRLARRA